MFFLRSSGERNLRARTAVTAKPAREIVSVSDYSEWRAIEVPILLEDQMREPQ